MKIRKLVTASFLFATLIVSVNSCTKKAQGEEESDCRMCTAFANGSQPEATQNICSDAAEQQFRSEHTGQEISCH